MARQCPPGTTAYTVRAGDTFYELARRFNTTVAAIMAANPGVNPNQLQIGQTICIPGQQPPSTCPAGSMPYVIRAGDTLFALAQRFNTTVNAILAINPGLDPNRLQIGQTICIPGQQPPSTCPAGSTPYVIRAGDTLFALAQRFNTTVNAILAINPGLDPNRLQIGQTICIPGQQPPSTCPAGSTPYVIRAGDTLFALAQRFNTTVNAILAINPGLDPNRLQIGQTICIPGQQPPSTCPANSFAYVIKAGDNLYMLALRYGTTVDAILAINPGLDPNRLQIGQTICIPGVPPTTCPPGSITYTIQSGDTLFTIATRYNVTVNAILAANPGLDPNNLRVGQIICIPGGTPTCPPNTTSYTVKAGDTFFRIARAHNVSLDALLAANPGIDPDRLQVGQVICIPN